MFLTLYNCHDCSYGNDCSYDDDDDDDDDDDGDGDSDNDDDYNHDDDDDDDDGDDDDDDDDDDGFPMAGDLHVVASWHRETTAHKLIVIYIAVIQN